METELCDDDYHALMNSISSVVMKYFVSDKFRLLYFLIATKGAACRELYVWYFDFSVRNRATKGAACRGLVV